MQARISKGSKRVEICDICASWDHKEAPAEAQCLALMKEMTERDPDCFAAWETHVAENPDWAHDDFQKTCSPTYLKELADFAKKCDIRDDSESSQWEWLLH